MYKTALIKLTYLLSFVCSVTIFNCDGRERATKKNVDILTEHNLLENFSKKIELVPKYYTEIETDTLLSNHFRVRINYHSTADKNIELSSKKNTTTYFSNFEALVNVSIKGSDIFKGIIDKSVFKTIENDMILEDSVMQYIWIDYESTTEDKIELKVSFYKPKTRDYQDFSISINKNGTILLKEINLLKSTA